MVRVEVCDTMTHIFEGTGAEIAELLAGEPYANKRLRVYIQDATPIDIDIPPPPFAVRDQAHLEELLLQSLDGPLYPVTDETWPELHRRIDEHTLQTRPHVRRM